MKKIALALLTLVLLCTLVAPVFAATTKNAFENIVLTANEDEFGYIANDQGRQHSTGTTIKFVENHGCGFTSEGDMVQFKSVDFGKNGAKEMTISASYDGEGTSTLAAYLDDPKGQPFATFSVTATGGWTMTYAKEFTTAVKVPGGVHDVYVKFTNANAGSFSTIRFTEADAPITGVGSAVATADMGVIASIAAIMTSAAGFVALKKR